MRAAATKGAKRSMRFAPTMRRRPKWIRPLISLVSAVVDAVRDVGVRSDVVRRPRTQSSSVGDADDYRYRAVRLRPTGDVRTVFNYCYVIATIYWYIVYVLLTYCYY